MLGWAIAFFVIAVVAAVLGFGGLVGVAFAGPMKILFFVFLVAFCITLLAGLVAGETGGQKRRNF